MAATTNMPAADRPHQCAPRRGGRPRGRGVPAAASAARPRPRAATSQTSNPVRPQAASAGARGQSRASRAGPCFRRTQSRPPIPDKNQCETPPTNGRIKQTHATPVPRDVHTHAHRGSHETTSSELQVARLTGAADNGCETSSLLEQPAAVAENANPIHAGPSGEGKAGGELS
ncbi:hypothetical protein PAHAL_9G469200 [Panicum hallii]|uniref:Uncharacterized protein n=1 Tax=Panicum hallii TaxID=206008 RepID=A0A2T8I4X7_9POAL|nr:hypothetical protein PAHAL_9G469200 [Panicum hallii]